MSNLTTADADAWHAAIAAAEREARRMGQLLRDAVRDDGHASSALVRQNAALCDQIADAIARLQPPREIETGLHGRGA